MLPAYIQELRCMLLFSHTIRVNFSLHEAASLTGVLNGESQLVSLPITKTLLYSFLNYSNPVEDLFDIPRIEQYGSVCIRNLEPVYIMIRARHRNELPSLM